MSLDLQVRTNPVPENFCFSGFNSASWLDILALLYVRFPDDATLFNFGSTTPPPDRRDRPWIRTNADGTPDRVYVYAMGAWLAQHEVVPGIVVMYEGSEASIDTFDGGEAGAVSDIGGPFWEKVSEMDARFPIGPGTTPAAPTGTGTVIAVGDTGGEELHVLTVAELAAHTHDVIISSNTAVDTKETLDNQGDDTATRTFTSEPTGGDAGHNTMPPWRAIHFIRRTNRRYRRI